MVSRIVPRLCRWVYKSLRLYHTLSWTWCNGYDCRLPVREISVQNLWIANFRFFFYEIYVQNQWGHKTLKFKWMTSTLMVQVRFPLVRIKYVFAFQIWYCELCVKKPMRGRQKALFWFLLFQALSHLNLSLPKVSNNWGKTVIRLVFIFVGTILTVKYCAKTSHFYILISFWLCCYLLRSIFLPGSYSTAAFNCPPL